MTNLPEKLALSPDALETRVGDETVLLHLANSAYYGLDPVGTVIWEGIKAGQTLSQVRDALIATYDAPAEVIAADMDRFLRDLLDNDILVASPG